MKLSHSFSSLKLYENCPLRYYHQRITRDIVDKGGEASIYGERIHKALELRLKSNEELPQDVASYEPITKSIEVLANTGTLTLEQQLTLNAELKPTSWFAKDAWLRSILDVLIVRNTTAYIFDWKTGKRRPDFTQLEMFALQAFVHYPELTSVRSSFVWLKDNALDTRVYKREDTPKLWEPLLARIQRIEHSLETNNWPARPSGLCKFCPMRNACDYA